MNELNTIATSGSSIYAIIRNSSNQIWQPTTSTFVTEVDGDFANYPISLTEQGATGFFSADFPTAITESGVYLIAIYKGAGSEADPFVSGGTINWNGSGESSDMTGDMLTSLDFVKDFGNITTSAYDNYLTNRIKTASAAISSWCNRTFPLTNYTDYIDGPGSTTLLLPHTPVSAITSITINAQSDQPTVISGENVIVNSDTGIVSIKPTATQIGWFSYDYFSAQQGIKVIYAAGYDTIPLDVQEACAQVVMNRFNLRGANVTMTSEKMLDYQYTRRSDAQKLLTEDIQATLFKYKDIAV